MLFISVSSSVLDLFLSINVLYYVMLHVLCWTAGRVVAAFATANGDPNKIHYMVRNMSIPLQMSGFGYFSHTRC